MKKIKSTIKKEYLAFNKYGIGGVQVFADSKADALKQARAIYGRGAIVEFRKNTRINVFSKYIPVKKKELELLKKQGIIKKNVTWKDWKKNMGG